MTAERPLTTRQGPLCGLSARRLRCLAEHGIYHAGALLVDRREHLTVMPLQRLERVAAHVRDDLPGDAVMAHDTNERRAGLPQRPRVRIGDTSGPEQHPEIIPRGVRVIRAAVRTREHR